MNRTGRSRRSLLWLTYLLAIPALAPAQTLAAFEQRTTVHVLPNGWTFIICERPTAPVFAFATHADVGAAHDPKGQTGLAHLFEHMAFKGTPVVGTTDYEKERVALDELEAAYLAYQAARDARRPDQEQVKKLGTLFEEKRRAAQVFVKSNAFDEILSRAGGIGLNAGTSSDSTVYYYSLPANKFELFAYLESERFSRPVFREFFTERDVVIEERRMRTESQPSGRLFEKFIGAAFLAHSYRNPVVGHRSDLERVTISDARAFFDRFYGPSNLVTAIVGGIKAREITPIIDKYFARIPPRPRPEALRTIEPVQLAEMVLTLRDPAQPLYLEGYHKPGVMHADQPAYEALSDVLTRGHTSRLYRLLVADKQLAVAVSAGAGFPGVKYPNLWVVYTVPARGVSNDAVRDAIRPELQRLQDEDISDEELARFKTRAKADLLRSLNTNTGLAEQLAAYHVLFGDWRDLFRYVERLDGVTKADVRRVAGTLFKETNRTVGRIETATPAASTVGGTGTSRQ